MKLLQHVYLVGGGAFGYSHPNDCNIYLIEGGKEMALVDTGAGAQLAQSIWHKWFKG